MTFSRNGGGVVAWILITLLAVIGLGYLALSRNSTAKAYNRIAVPSTAAAVTADVNLPPIPPLAPLPDLGRRPATHFTPVELAFDPFPKPQPAPAKTNAPSSPVRRASPRPPLPPPNPVAEYVMTAHVAYIGYVEGAQPVATFRVGNKYLVMSVNDTFPGTDIQLTDLKPNAALLTQGPDSYILKREK